MNQINMLGELTKTRKRWHRDALDVNEPERGWINGVVYGLDIAIEIIKRHIKGV